LWALLILLFFSASSRLEHYAFPLIPPLALLAGLTFASREIKVRRVIRWGFGTLAALGLILLLASMVLTLLAFGALEMPLTGSSSPDRTFNTDFAIMLEMPAMTVSRLVRPAIGITCLLGFLFLVAYRYGRRERNGPALLVLTLAMVFFPIAAGHSIVLVEDVVSTKGIGRSLAEIHSPGDTVVILGDYESANSIHFYVPSRLLICGGSAASIEAGLPFSAIEELVITPERLRYLWNSPQRVFLVAVPERVRDMELQPLYEITHIAGRSLYCNIGDNRH
jgi:hypothetical protein